jgi:hypothetical protein
MSETIIPLNTMHDEPPLVSCEVVQASRVRIIADGIIKNLTDTLQSYGCDLREGLAVMRLVNDDINHLREAALQQRHQRQMDPQDLMLAFVMITQGGEDLKELLTQ